ncbi:WD40 repeat domain-containing protein [Dictyobacter arantiisoli]|uniref:Anaphase-promoting complex subunit 4-like WD40 domain-containing protein n=1 Tax=Dictyobacter arantiisoli TaxID=2014874 RepID=A0A5A5TI27_9CHLR|nr:WD40 repeat domain-containing protein [Dictyobacter arantiisoli]GCF10669.1 hypothetical protein KDI_42330 [Dictyobacter arantiisoli]
MSELPFQNNVHKEKSVNQPSTRNSLSRRTFLKRGGLVSGGVLLALGGAFLWEKNYWHDSAIYTFHDTVYSVTWSPSGKRLATLNADGALHVWDTSTYTTTYSSHATGNIPTGATRWSPNGQYIASCDQNHAVRIWNTNNWSSFTNTSNMQTDVTSLAWSPDSNFVAVGSANKLVCIYHVTAGKTSAAELAFTYDQHQDGITTLAWASNGTYIASGSLDGTVRIWHPTTGVTQATFSDPAIHPITAVTWSPDNQMLAFTFGPKEDNLQPMSTHIVQVVHIPSGSVVSSHTGHSDYVASLSWSSNGAYIASASDDTTVHIWQPKQAQNVYIYRGHTARVRNVVWAPDNIHLATTSEDNTLQVWQNS